MPIRRIIALATMVALGACAGRQAGPESRPEEAKAMPTRQQRIGAALAQSVRVVVADKGKAVRSASGVTVGTSFATAGAVSFIITNAHVVAAKEGEEPLLFVLVDLPTGDTQEFPARLEALGKVPETDLAILSIQGVSLQAAELATDEELLIGDDVFAVAAPYGRALSVSGGLISQVDFEKGERRVTRMIKTDAAIGYGASGGGIFSATSGKLLGIVEGYRTAKLTIPVADEAYSFDLPMPGETFAAPTAKIRAFMREKGLTKLLDGSEPLTTAQAR